MPDLTKLVADETFTDDRFGQVDLSAFPHLQQPALDGFDAEDKHGFNQVERSGTSALRALADNPDTETLERIASETNDPKLIEQVTDEKEYREAKRFMDAHPSYHRDDSNYEAIRVYLDGHKLPFTSENIAVAFKALTKAGELSTDPAQPKALTNQERLHVITLAKENKTAEALEVYLSYSLPMAADAWENETDFLTDPSTIRVRTAAVRFVFFQSNIQARDTDEFRKFESDFFKNHPVRSLADYSKCVALFEKQANDVSREKFVFGPEPVSSDDLNELSDDRINALTHATLKKRMKERRA